MGIGTDMGVRGCGVALRERDLMCATIVLRCKRCGKRRKEFCGVWVLVVVSVSNELVAHPCPSQCPCESDTRSFVGCGSCSNPCAGLGICVRG